jgi:exonuclease SbcD
VRLIHAGDLHLGFEVYREEGYDYFKPLRYSVDYAIEKSFDLFIIAGDLFDRRDPSAFIQMGFAKEVKRLIDKGIEVLVITGNHDGSPNPERNIHLDIYRELELTGVIVSKKMELLNIKGLNIITVPYPFKRNLFAKDEYKEKTEGEIAIIMNNIIVDGIGSLLENTDKSLPTILVAHLPLLEGTVGEEVYSSFTVDAPISIEAIDRADFCYIAMGHFHKKQVLMSRRFSHPFVYSGSIDRINFSEETEEKGFFEVTIDEGSKGSSFSFVKNPYARNFYSIHLKKDNDLEGIDWEKVKSSITRVIVHNDMEDEGLFKKIIDRIKNDALVFAGVEDKRIVSDSITRTAFKISISPKEAIEKYLSMNNDQFINENRGKILGKALEILRQIEHDSQKQE